MGKDIKILVGAIVFTFTIIVGLALLAKRNSDSQNKLDQVAGISARPEFYDMGEVSMDGGTVTRDYEIKNTTGQKITLKKIVTSCMCTSAKVKIGDKETKYFGMEGHGDANAPVNIDLAPGEIAIVTIKFDPAAHGPQGVGPFDRTVYLTFSDPAGIKELKFSGTVVSK